MTREEQIQLIRDTPVDYIDHKILELWTSIAAQLKYGFSLSERQSSIIANVHSSANFRKRAESGEKQLPLDLQTIRFTGEANAHTYSTKSNNEALERGQRKSLQPTRREAKPYYAAQPSVWVSLMSCQNCSSWLGFLKIHIRLLSDYVISPTYVQNHI